MGGGTLDSSTHPRDSLLKFALASMGRTSKAVRTTRTVRRHSIRLGLKVIAKSKMGERRVSKAVSMLKESKGQGKRE